MRLSCTEELQGSREGNLELQLCGERKGLDQGTPHDVRPRWQASQQVRSSSCPSRHCPSHAKLGRKDQVCYKLASPLQDDCQGVQPCRCHQATFPRWWLPTRGRWHEQPLPLLQQIVSFRGGFPFRQPLPVRHRFRRWPSDLLRHVLQEIRNEVHYQWLPSPEEERYSDRECSSWVHNDWWWSFQPLPPFQPQSPLRAIAPKWKWLDRRHGSWMG